MEIRTLDETFDDRLWNNVVDYRSRVEVPPAKPVSTPETDPRPLPAVVPWTSVVVNDDPEDVVLWPVVDIEPPAEEDEPS